MVVPAQFGNIGIPYQTVGILEGTAVFPAPCEDISVTAAFQNAGTQGLVGDLQKPSAHCVRAFPQIRLEFFPESPGGEEADFSYHTRKILQTIGFLQWAAWQGGGIWRRHKALIC